MAPEQMAQGFIIPVMSLLSVLQNMLRSVCCILHGTWMVHSKFQASPKASGREKGLTRPWSQDTCTVL